MRRDKLWNWYKTMKDHAVYQAIVVQKSVVKKIHFAKRKLEWNL